MSFCLLSLDPLRHAGGVDQVDQGPLNDFHVFDLVRAEWTTPVVSGSPPSAREAPGLACASGKLYVYGGNSNPVGEAALRQRGFPH